jgi:hypothetical protein
MFNISQLFGKSPKGHKKKSNNQEKPASGKNQSVEGPHWVSFIVNERIFIPMSNIKEKPSE